MLAGAKRPPGVLPARTHVPLFQCVWFVGKHVVRSTQARDQEYFAVYGMVRQRGAFMESGRPRGARLRQHASLGSTLCLLLGNLS